MRSKYPVTLTILFSGATLIHAQSLGDAAKANREKEGTAPKATVVVTTDDMQNDSKGGSPVVGPNGTKSSKTQKPSVQPVKETVDPRVAASWKRRILEQTEKVKTLQAQIDQLSASIDPPGGAEFNGPPSRDRAKLMQRRSETQLQLDSQKRKLEQLQEEARQAGMHTPTYDP